MWLLTLEQNVGIQQFSSAISSPKNFNTTFATTTTCTGSPRTRRASAFSKRKSAPSNVELSSALIGPLLPMMQRKNWHCQRAKDERRQVATTVCASVKVALWRNMPHRLKTWIVWLSHSMQLTRVSSACVHQHWPRVSTLCALNICAYAWQISAQMGVLLTLPLP